MKKSGQNRVLLAELAMSGVFHTGVNAGLSEMSKHVYPAHELVFYGEKRHLERLRERIPGLYRPFPLFPAVNKYTLLPRDILGCIYLVGIWLRSRRGDILFVTHLLPLTHWCASLLNILWCRPLFIVLHGQLEAFLPGTPLRGTKPYFRLHGPLLRRDRRARYVVLGEAVFRQIPFLFGVRTKTVVIDHPYDYSAAEPVPPPYRYPLRFGQTGTGNRGKGTGNLFRLAELLQDEIRCGQVELTLVGRPDPEFRCRTDSPVRSHPAPLSASAFDREAASLHYTLQLRDRETGRATPSGSFFDTVKYGKPFLALDNAFPAHYARRFPGCGTLFSSLEELAEAIRRLCSDPGAEEYGRQTEAVAQARASLSAERIAETFQQQIRL